MLFISSSSSPLQAGQILWDTGSTGGLSPCHFLKRINFPYHAHMTMSCTAGLLSMSTKQKSRLTSEDQTARLNGFMVLLTDTGHPGNQFQTSDTAYGYGAPCNRARRLVLRQ